MRAVRGATTLEVDTPEATQEAVGELINLLLDENQIVIDDIVSVFFTVTSDLRSFNPARATRLVRGDWQWVPMLCSQEPDMATEIPRCIRVLIQWVPNRPYSDPPKPVYLRQAAQLRPDIS